MEKVHKKKQGHDRWCNSLASMSESNVNKIFKKDYGDIDVLLPSNWNFNLSVPCLHAMFFALTPKNALARKSK